MQTAAIERIESSERTNGNGQDDAFLSPFRDDNAARVVDGVGGDDDGAAHARWLSRSPHPYRRSAADRQRARSPGSSLSGSPESPRSTESPSPRLHVPADPEATTYRQHRGARPVSTLGSDSGTEADDEHVLKGLPAPRGRPHKGVLGGNDAAGLSGMSSGLSTPLLSPARMDGATDAQDVRDARGPSPEQIQKRRQANRRREVVRRSTEVLLLVVLGGMVCTKTDVQAQLVRWWRVLRAGAVTTGGLCLLYPARVLLWTWQRGRPPRLAVPFAFDPAPLLYPATMPVLVALLLATPTLPAAPLLNAVLAVCALPRPLIPLAVEGELFAAVHWVLSVLVVDTAAAQSVALSPETLSLVYPLHQTLCWLLSDLTTTSLLPAEVQLLSIGQVNLLLLATSPQAVLLQAIFWGGGLGLLISCSAVVRWGVALARVPRWRFRRGSAQQSEGGVFSPVLDVFRCLAAELSLTRRARLERMFGPAPADRRRHRPERRGDGRWDSDSTNADDYKFAQEAAGVSSEDDAPRERVERPLRLHNTHSTRKRHRKSGSANLQAFFSLTAAQAARRRWLYAGWMYGSVVAVVLGPVRRYVSTWALHGHEAVGWALGYLLGDVSAFRLEVVKANLERWVCLPVRGAGLATAVGRVEQLRLRLGAANARLVLLSYWLAVLAVGLAVVLQLSPVCAVDTRRKVFHFMMVTMLLPTTFVDPACVALALALALAVFLLLDLLRASQLPPLSRPIATFLAPYVDGRDLRGPVVVSHIFLLVGCALPLWLSVAAVPRLPAPAADCTAGWNLETRDVSMVAGVVCVGLGDAAASLMGRRWGRHKWLWGGGKSLEGSLAFAVAVVGGLLAAAGWLRLGGWQREAAASVVDVRLGVVSSAAACATMASLTEAVLTGGNDNVVVPVVLWTCVKSLL